MGEVWAIDTITLNFSMELDSTECYMGFGEIKFLKWCDANSSNSCFFAILNEFSEFLKIKDFTKTQKCRYLENETLFFLQTKKFINYISRATLWQKNTFAAEFTFK